MTDRQLVDAAWAEILTATITPQEWQTRVTNGYRGKPYNWQNTAYGRAKLLLDQVDSVAVVAAPKPPFVGLDGKAETVSFPSSFVRTTEPTVIRRLKVTNVTGYGVGSMQYYPPTEPNPGRTLVEDCIVENVYANPPRSMDGTGEAGFWFGNPTTARRLVARNCAWMGMWTGSHCTDSIIEDFDIESPYIGLYVEHVTKLTTFRRFKIKTETGNGINVEWWYREADGALRGSHDLTFEDGNVYCPAGKYGIYVDAGTYGCTFNRIRFWGPGNAICLPNNRVDPTTPNLTFDCVYDNQGSALTYHDNPVGT